MAMAALQLAMLQRNDGPAVATQRATMVLL
jgi:hypothetical protein